MDRSWLNKLNREKRIDPKSALKKLRTMVEFDVALSDLAPDVKALRTQGLKRHREIRAACLFCYGLSCWLQQPVWVYPIEDADYDFVAGWDVAPDRHFAPVQLKEVVPEELNPNSSLQSIVDGLIRYQASEQLTAAIHVNRQGRFDPRTIAIPSLKIAALWIFAAMAEDQSRWGLYGNMLEEPVLTEFDYPG
jgi:hypothetical protein